MKNQRFNLLTTVIVAALHPNEPQQEGTKWEPTNVIDIKEAEDLCELGYAEKRDAVKGDKLTLTVLQKQDQAKADAEAAEDDGEDDDGDDLSEEDQVLTLILQGNADAVEGELPGLTVEQLRRLDELENGENGKGRKGVTEAIHQAITEAEKSE